MGGVGRTGASMNSSETSSLTLSVARDGMDIKKICSRIHLHCHAWVEEEKDDLNALAC